MTNLQTYGKPSFLQTIRNYFKPKTWYKVYAPITTGNSEEEQ